MNAYELNFARGGPSYIGNLAIWAAACGLAGHLEKARELVKDALREQPGLFRANVQDVLLGLSDSELEKLGEGLRKAGLPE